MKGFYVAMALWWGTAAFAGADDALEPIFDQLRDTKFEERATGSEALMEWCQQQDSSAEELLLAQLRRVEDPEARARVIGAAYQSLMGRGQGFLGINFQLMTMKRPDGGLFRGVAITMLSPGGPAKRVGLRPGDLLFSVGPAVFEGLGNPAEVPELVKKLAPGKNYKVRFLRDGRVQTVQVQLDERPRSIFEEQRRRQQFEERVRKALGAEE